MGGGKGSAPPPPDYGPIGAANEEAARISAEVSREQLAWAREQYAMDRADNQELTEAYLPLIRMTAQAAIDDRARYETQYQPLEDALIEDARTAGSEANQERTASRNVAAVDQQFEAARAAAEARMAGFGIDPSQVRSGALDLGTRVQEASAKAGAANAGRDQEINIGRALRSEAINIGRGYPGQVAQAVGSATATGQAGVNANLATTASGAATMGTGLGWAQNQTSILGNWGRDAANMYGSYAQAQSQRSSPWGAVGGMLGSLGGGWASGGFMVKDGGAIPHEASPSKGAIPDDVPAHVTAGEYVIPAEVVRRKGTDFFDKMIGRQSPHMAGAPAPRLEEKPKGGAGKPAAVPPMDPGTMERLVAGLLAPLKQGEPAHG